MVLNEQRIDSLKCELVAAINANSPVVAGEVARVMARVGSQMLADQFNDKVWGSPEMRQAIHLCGTVFGDLTAKGWGLMALDMAEDHVMELLVAIRKMKGFRL